MNGTSRFAIFFLGLALSAGALSACDGDPPATPDGGTDAGAPEGQIALPGLDGPVEVIVDDRGVPHIYGSTRHDVLVVQGYMMCRDRFGQMEFIRRSVLGRLAEVAGADQIPADIEARHASYGRIGRDIYESLPPTDPTRVTAESFVEGINLYIDAVNARTEDPTVRGAEVVNLILSSPFFGHWEPADVFAMARFQAVNLSYDAEPEVRRSRQLAAALAAFPEGSADARLAARAGFFSDMLGERPARAVFTRDGFNDGTSEAFFPLGLPPGERPGEARPGTLPYLPSLASLDGALPFLERQQARGERIFGDVLSRGSNNWLVAGEHTASGNPILSNDPHLSLISPPVWWYVHLNTVRNGATGADAIDAQGVAFAGLPGVVLGFNRDIAWGATTTGYDVTDVYEEQITGSCDESGNVIGGSVRFDGAEVAVQFHDEVVHVSGESDGGMTVRLPYVPHHGLFLPGSCAPVTGMTGHFTAISVRYTGDEVSNELAYFTGLMTATSVEEARDAQDAFRVGSQNFIVIDRSSIFWSSESRIPIRDARAMTFAIDPATGVPSGLCPHLVLPGTGEYEWTGDLADTAIPHDLDPARGWIATANQDNVGVTADGNPCNDDFYLGANFDYGWRQARISERLAELVARGDVTTADMIALQGESQSQLGRQLRDPIVAILETPLLVIPTLSAADQARLADARTRLMAWDFETPHGVGATDSEEIASSIATTIFNAAITRIIPLAFADEMDAMGGGGPGAQGARLLEWAMTDAGSLFTYSASVGDTVLWDDLDTVEIETRAQIVLRGVLAGLDFLEERLGDDPGAWLWGRLHTVRFDSVIPSLGVDVLSIPPEDSVMFPDGFPRHGDNFAVDPGNFGMWNTSSFSFGSGASQRLVLEMTADGPIAFNALPGGQSLDPDSTHKSDEAELWRTNQQPPLYFDESDVTAHHERTWTFVSP